MEVQKSATNTKNRQNRGAHIKHLFKMRTKLRKISFENNI